MPDAPGDRLGDVRAAAARYLADRCGADGQTGAAISRLPDLEMRLDDGFFAAVAADFEQAPRMACDEVLGKAYSALRRETLAQYRAMLDAGIRVQPWLGGGQPYASSRRLRAEVRRTGVVKVFLTSRGHGQGQDDCYHPLREPAGVTIGGVDLVYNDLFRAVHDVFGHVMLGVDMATGGELRAAFCHMLMYPEEAHPAIFVEQVSQICWFFHGPHLRDDTGRLPVRGEPGWIPPRERPYPEQKVFRCPPHFIDEFKSAFREESK